MDSLLQKQFVLDEIKEVEEEERTLHFIISTDSVDRDQDTIAVDGWQLENYMRNPVVLFAHDYKSLPVARSIATWVENGVLNSVAKFTSKELYPFGYMVYNFYKEKILKAVSVGFKPIKWEYSNDDGRKYGVDFLEQELLEFSCVPVPSNPEALLRAKGFRIDTTPGADKLIVPVELELKSGRVLSEANENRIRQATELLEEVLDQLEVADETEASDEPEKEFATTEEAKIFKEELENYFKRRNDQ